MVEQNKTFPKHKFSIHTGGPTDAGFWWLRVIGQIGEIMVNYCPFCGKKLQ